MTDGNAKATNAVGPGALPASATPEQIERHWFNTVYQGDQMPQLTLRAILMGSVLGGFMSLSNLYVGLKTGWALGVAITACILSFSIHRGLRLILPRVFTSPMSILENNCMQSTASSAGYSTGGTMVSAVAAYLLVTGQHIPWMVLGLWTFFLAVLGVFLAVPLKRQMINIEQLRFPSGIAAAETLRSLHAAGGVGVDKARALGCGGLLGAAITWLRDAGKPFALPEMLHFPGVLGGFPLAKWTLSFEMSAIMIAAGAIIGWKVCWSMLLGSLVNYAVLAPAMVRLGDIDAAKLGYRAIVSWSTWTGAAIMVTSGLAMFLFQWRTVARSLRGLGKLFKGPGAGAADPMERIEVPPAWFAAGTLFAGLGCILILYYAFGTSLWMGLLAVLLTFFLSLVACRATGEADITPIGAMGKITQLLFGVLAPSNMTTNLMTASVTAGAASSAADLLTDLKSGYLLGANPRKQFLAQLLGVFTGVLVVVPAFYLLVPDAAALGSDKWPAPSAQVWAAVAKILSKGFFELPLSARIGLGVGGFIGILIPILEKLFPKAARFIPSAMGLGLAMVIPFWNALSMFIGAVIALVLQARRPALADKYVVPVSSGIIAGESLLGVVVALLKVSGVL